MKKFWSKISLRISEVVGYSIIALAVGSVTLFWLYAIILALFDPLGGSAM